MSIAILLGLSAALAWGLSDFVAGLLSRRAHYAIVAVIGRAVAFALAIVALAVTTRTAPSAQAVVWGAVSGVGSAFGTLVLYRGLGRGRMGVVAPLSALGSAVLPVVIGVALGDRPSALAWSGILLALPAIWFVSTTRGADVEPVEEVAVSTSVLAAGVADGLLAGVAFALLYIGLDLAGDGAGLWPVVAGQGTSLVLLTAVLYGVLRTLDTRRLPRRDIAVAALAGVLVVTASVLYFLSTHTGLLSIVAVLTSLYPAPPVLLAALVLHESVSRRQATGLALAGTAIILIVLG